MTVKIGDLRRWNSCGANVVYVVAYGPFTLVSNPHPDDEHAYECFVLSASSWAAERGYHITSRHEWYRSVIEGNELVLEGMS